MTKGEAIKIVKAVDTYWPNDPIMEDSDRGPWLNTLRDVNAAEAKAVVKLMAAQSRPKPSHWDFSEELRTYRRKRLPEPVIVPDDKPDTPSPRSSKDLAKAAIAEARAALEAME